jgi:hypothetical protein
LRNKLDIVKDLHCIARKVTGMHPIGASISLSRKVERTLSAKMAGFLCFSDLECLRGLIQSWSSEQKIAESRISKIQELDEDDQFQTHGSFRPLHFFGVIG